MLAETIQQDNFSEIVKLGINVNLSTGQIYNLKTGNIIVPTPVVGGLRIYFPYNVGHEINRRTSSLARVVLWAGVEAGLCDKPKIRQVAGHKDGDWRNNAFSNLEWMSRRTVAHRSIIREVTNRPGFLLHHINDIRLLLRSGFNINALATAYGVHPSSISYIKNKKTWSWIPKDPSLSTINEVRMARVERAQAEWERYVERLKVEGA
jgi:hypothetical protein